MKCQNISDISDYILYHDIVDKRLKEFLEDYDDERDDPKYYK